MKDPAGFLRERARCGVFAAPASVAALREAAGAGGLVWFDLDLAGVRSKPDFLARCRHVFALPRDFGDNLDALADSLQDLSWRPARGYVVNISNGTDFVRSAPADFAALLEILAAAAMYWDTQRTLFVVLLDASTSGSRAFEPLPESGQYKIPISVLVVIHTPDLEVLLLERADRPGFWQSVTGSQDAGETLLQTAQREVFEETGLDAAKFALVDWERQNEYEIYQRWRGRYAPGVTHNTEHVFGLRVPSPIAVTLAPREHLQFMWLPWRAAADKVFSWSNADAIRKLPQLYDDARSGGHRENPA